MDSGSKTSSGLDREPSGFSFAILRVREFDGEIRTTQRTYLIEVGPVILVHRWVGARWVTLAKAAQSADEHHLAFEKLLELVLRQLKHISTKSNKKPTHTEIENDCIYTLLLLCFDLKIIHERQSKYRKKNLWEKWQKLHSLFWHHDEKVEQKLLSRRTFLLSSIEENMYNKITKLRIDFLVQLDE